jgi:uncharacterized protein YacL
MSLDLIARLLGMTVFAGIGANVGARTAEVLNLDADASSLLFMLAGALFGLLITPWFTTRPAEFVRRSIIDTDAETLVTSMAGLVFGMVVGGLFAWPLSLLPKPYGQLLPGLVAITIAYVSVGIFALRARDILRLFGAFVRGEVNAVFPIQSGEILLDTSVIIDGRVLDLSQTGFITQKMLIPQFVIHELQNIADSSDALRRQRGRHGLDILNQMKNDSLAPVEIIHDTVEDGKDVDDKLVVLAREMDIPIMTNDYNLNKTANVQGVFVLNVNDLAMALRPVYLPGEIINLHIIQEGKEPSQGVGYLIDGTMVVVEDGKRYRDRTVPVKVTRYILSSAGKMYFAQPAND